MLPRRAVGAQKPPHLPLPHYKSRLSFYLCSWLGGSGHSYGFLHPSALGGADYSSFTQSLAGSDQNLFYQDP